MTLITSLENLQVQATARCGPGQFEYRGFFIRWTGYKPTLHDSRLSGQWLALSLHTKGAGPYFYADISGKSGEYRKGDAFDTSGAPSLESAVEEVVDATALAKMRLLSMVDERLGEYRGHPSGEEK